MKTKEFTFGENAPIRVLPLLKNEENWFIAPDICAILELGNVTKALDRLDDDEKQLVKIEHKGQVRELNIINESGLYALVLCSTKPEARVFRKWITSEVLPTIRKAGKYTVETAKNKQLLLQTVAAEIQQIENKIETLRKEAKDLVVVKDERYLYLRKIISADDSQLEIVFNEQNVMEGQVSKQIEND